MRAVFFGTPHFAATVLRHLLHSGKHEIAAIVSKPDKPQGRQQKILPTAVKAVADEIAPHIPLLQPQKASDPAFIETLKSYDADIFVVVAYGEIVKKSVLDIPKFGCINIHASLLPLYRGAAPMQRCLIDGVSETGITIMKMDVGLDSGDILLKKSCPVPFDLNLGQLSAQLQEMSCTAIDEALALIASGKVVFTPQDSALVTFAPKVTKEESRLNLLEPAQSLHNRVRAFAPSPGAWIPVYIRDEAKRLKVFQTDIISGRQALPGELIVTEDGFGVGTAEGVLVLKRVQLEGRGVVSAIEFLRGYPIGSFSFKQ